MLCVLNIVLKISSSAVGNFTLHIYVSNVENWSRSRAVVPQWQKMRWGVVKGNMMCSSCSVRFDLANLMFELRWRKIDYNLLTLVQKLIHNVFERKKMKRISVQFFTDLIRRGWWWWPPVVKKYKNKNLNPYFQ